MTKRVARDALGEHGNALSMDKVVGLTRAGAAALLHVSSSTVRRLEERGVLHPQVVDGVHVFDAEEVRRAQFARPSSAPTDGDAAALAFQLLDQGMNMRDIVKRCRVTPERARTLATEWKKMGNGELVVSVEARAGISRMLGGVRLPSCDALISAVRTLVEDRDWLERELADARAEQTTIEELVDPERLREFYTAREQARSAAEASNNAQADADAEPIPAS